MPGGGDVAAPAGFKVMVKICAFALLALPLSFLAMLRDHAAAQERVKPLDPNKARTTYSFPVRPGGELFRFKVELDQTSTVSGVSVFREGDASPFQTLPACKDAYSEELTEYDEALELLEHADLNFDGFEDVKLLQFYQPHLGTKVFCIYTWDNKSGHFRYAPEIPGLNPVPHPENKTITVHQDWMGGAYADSTYRWNGAKTEEIEFHGRGYGSDDPKCGFTDHCNKLINGQMVITLWRPVVCSDDRPDPELICPAGARRPAPNAPKKQPSRKTEKP